MKVLCVTPEFPPDFGGGIGRYCQDLVAGLKAQGCEVAVLKGSALVNGAAYEFAGTQVSVLATDRYNRWLGRFGHFSMFPGLRRHLAAAFAMHEQVNAGQGFDVVEVTDWGLLFLPWVMHSQARVMVQFHGSCGQISAREPDADHLAEESYLLLLETTALAAAAGMSAYSHGNAQWWEEILSKSVAYLPPPLSVTPVTSERSGADRWLAVGRIQSWKGPHVAGAAWQLLGAQAPQLEWVGRDTKHGASGPSTKAWLQREFPSVWPHKIQPVGQFAPQEVRQRMLRAKAVLVPSLWDTFNLAAAEAMALGKVVVVSDGAGVADLIEHGVNGFIFPCGSAEALAKLVLQADRMSQAELEAIGRRAADTIRKQLNPPLIATEKLKLYQSLPPPKDDAIPWLRESLLPAATGKPLGFLDELPFKELAGYVARRGFKKLGA